jgi:hypothetical protein
VMSEHSKTPSSDSSSRPPAWTRAATRAGTSHLRHSVAECNAILRRGCGPPPTLRNLTGAARERSQMTRAIRDHQDGVPARRPVVRCPGGCGDGRDGRRPSEEVGVLGFVLIWGHVIDAVRGRRDRHPPAVAGSSRLPGRSSVTRRTSGRPTGAALRPEVGPADDDVTPPRPPTRQPRRPFTRSPPCPPDASSVRRTPKDPGACDT